MEDDQLPQDEPAWSEGLRERKKRITRQLISDTATAMCLERGFDDVKVTEVADACGVSEKTVYNYFPTKESLLLDREADVAASIWRALGPASTAKSPVDGFRQLLAGHLDEMEATWASGGLTTLRRFAELIEATPSLRAAERDMADRLARTATEAIAEQAGVSPEDPEPQIAAAALMGLWTLQSEAIRRCAAEERSPAETREVAVDVVNRAARLVESGLWSFSAVVEGHASRQQFKVAADAAQQAGRQVAAAVRQARASWQQMQREAAKGEQQGPPSPLQGLAALLEQAEQAARAKREDRGQRGHHGRHDQQDEWKRAYREQQAIIRQAQRELQQRFRQAANQQWQDAAGRGRGRGGQSDGGPGGAG
ncbi:MAG: TetR/AcrR family transcriptional regulator [Acidimicrobiales bacterium]